MISLKSSTHITTVECPSCNTSVKWLKENEFRPFCSASCKNKDFVDWANEERRLAGSSNYDDIFSGELE